MAWTYNLELSPYRSRITLGADAFEVLKEDDRGSGRVFVIHDRELNREIVDTVVERFQSSGYEVEVAGFEIGERTKTVDTATEIYDYLGAKRAERFEPLVAIGGGVTLDLVGFVGATWLRGVPLIFVPTTLTAMVDAGLGGKTGVNTNRGKNLVGSFYPAERIIQYPPFLNSLPEREWLSGIAEAIKHGLVFDEDLFNFLIDQQEGIMARSVAVVEEFIRRNVKIKCGVVTDDFKEGANRIYLNYGHTIGHALERESGYGEIAHGEAITVGMLTAARLAVGRGLADAAMLETHSGILGMYGLIKPLAKEYDVGAVIEATLQDKKVRSRQVSWVLLNGLRNPQVVTDIGTDEVERALGESLEQCQI